MSFSASAAPDITEGLPFLLSAAEATRAITNKKGVDFDIEIGGVGFRLASIDSAPYVRQTAPFQKQQLDTSREAGEHTLSQFWVRSQTSWHRGAGIVQYEPGSDETTPYRFDTSLGVDVWKEGDLSLLRSCSVAAPVSAGQVAYATGAVVGGVDVVFTNENGVVKRRTASGNTAYTGINNAATPVALAGAKILVGRPTSIAVGDSNGSTLADLWTGAASAPRPYWVKSRIIAAVGPELHELTLAGGAFATPFYTHPDAGWVWTSVVAAPGAILAAGHSNGHSEIFAFALEAPTSGASPKLGAAISMADMPTGEVIHALHVYLGRYVGIGTSHGIRVGMVDTGQLQYGPLIVQTTQPVRSLTAADRFLYGAVTSAQPDGKSGAVRIDLQAEIRGQSAPGIMTPTSLRFPYAWDARTGTAGRVDTIAMLGNTDRVVLGVSGEGIYFQSDTVLEPTGYLDTGRLRFSTVEPKAFRTMDVTATIPGGSLSMESVEKDGDASFLGRLTSRSGNGMDIRINRPLGTFEWLTFRFTLNRDSTDPTVGPVLESWQVKAIPTPRRQRMISIPLLCLDLEDDRYGTPYGYEGYAWDRLQALEEVEDHSAVVMFTDKTTGEAFEAQIEQTTFTKVTPADPAKSNQGNLLLLLRKLG